MDYSSDWYSGIIVINIQVIIVINFCHFDISFVNMVAISEQIQFDQIINLEVCSFGKDVFRTPYWTYAIQIKVIGYCFKCRFNILTFII